MLIKKDIPFSFNFATWVKIAIYSILLFIVLTYYIHNTSISPVFIMMYAFLTAWITWRDLKGYIIKDNLLLIVFAMLSFFINRQSYYEYFITAFFIASLVMIADYLSTGYRFTYFPNEKTKSKVEKLYFGTAGYLIGWTQATIVLLLAYMLFPIETNYSFQSMVNGWQSFINSIILPFICIVILCVILHIQYERKKNLEKNNSYVVYYKNIRPHSIWFLAFFGALLGFPVTLTIIIFSFILYIPIYIFKFFTTNESDKWIEEVTVNFYSNKK